MEEIQLSQKKKELHVDGRALIFIHSSFCGTCHMARKMLDTIELTWGRTVFLEMNAALHPNVMKHYQIESVPCLLIIEEGKLVEKVYAFRSVSHMYEIVSENVSYSNYSPRNNERL